MRKFIRSHSIPRALLGFLIVVLAFTPLPTGHAADSSRQGREDEDRNRERGGDRDRFRDCLPIGSEDDDRDKDDRGQDDARNGNADEGDQENGDGRRRRQPCVPTGSAGAAKGDFNGDGFGDLAIGIPGEDVGGDQDAGAVTIIYGSTNGLTAIATATVPASQFWSQDTTGVLDSAEPGDSFGSALAAGDFDDDGFSDLAIGVPGEDSELTLTADAGAVNILFGSAIGLTANFDQFVANPLIQASGDGFGTALVWAFFNGDTFADLAVGIPRRNIQLGLDPPLGTGGTAIDAGAVAVFYGSSAGLDTASLQFVHQTTSIDIGDSYGDIAETQDFFGAPLAAGDFNGDNIFDLAVGIPYEELPPANVEASGAVHIIYGSSSGLNPAAIQLLSQDTSGMQDTAERSDFFGQAVAAGDLNGDTFHDLAIGVPSEDLVNPNDPGTNQREAGAVHVIYGSDSGLLPGGGPSIPANQFWSQNNAGIPSGDGVFQFDDFGSALAMGFLNGDAFKDLAVGVPGENVGLKFHAGAVNVIYGSANGLLTNAGPGAQFWHRDSPGIQGTAQARDRFGSVLTAWDFGNGGQADLAIGVPLPFVLSGGVVFAGAGEVNVIYGGAGLTATGNQLWSQDTPGVPDIKELGDRFGAALY